jgi:hypothetical protein
MMPELDTIVFDEVVIGLNRDSLFRIIAKDEGFYLYRCDTIYTPSDSDWLYVWTYNTLEDALDDFHYRSFCLRWGGFFDLRDLDWL